MLNRGQQQQACSSADGDGFATYTHAVGLGYGKSGKLQQAWLKQQDDAAAVKMQLPQLPFISNSCEVSSLYVERQGRVAACVPAAVSALILALRNNTGLTAARPGCHSNRHRCLDHTSSVHIT
jgi:hypothetical protein